MNMGTLFTPDPLGIGLVLIGVVLFLLLGADKPKKKR